MTDDERLAELRANATAYTMVYSEHVRWALDHFEAERDAAFAQGAEAMREMVLKEMEDAGLRYIPKAVLALPLPSPQQERDE